MARYPYSPALKTPGNWSAMDFADPRLSSAVKLMVSGIREEVRSFSPPEGVRLTRKRMTVWDGEETEVFVLEPEEGCPSKARMLYCHGGGFFLPVQVMMMNLAAQYALQLGIRVVLPEYRILPDHRSPYPFRDCLSVLDTILAEKGPYLLYGESAGGTLAAGLALWARDHGMAAAKGQCLVYPVLDDKCSRYVSMRTYSEAAWPLRNNLNMWKAYLGDNRDSVDYYTVPMSAPDVSGLPPAYIEPQQIDILRDEAVCYGKRLEDAGNDVTVNLIQLSYHGFDADVQNDFVQSVVRQRIEVMRRMLNDKEESL